MNATVQRVAGKLARANNSGVMARTAILTATNLLSPATGLLVEIGLAWTFGASGTIDAYRATVLLLIYGQQLFVTSILSAVLVPIFAECRAQGKEQDAWIIVDSIAWVLLLFGIVVAAFLFVWPNLAVNTLAPGLSGNVRETAIFFMRWCGLAFIPMCWTGAACGILYAYNMFHVAPVSQATGNVILIFAIALQGARWGSTSIVVGVLGGILASTSIYMFAVAGLRRQFGPKQRLKHVDFGSLNKAFRIAAPMFGAAVARQGTTIIANRALSRLAVGSLAAFGYAWKTTMLVQFAPNALATVLFPKVSESWYSKGRAEFQASCMLALRATVYITMPLTSICYMHHSTIIALLFQRGAFTASHVQLAGMLFGLLVLCGPATCAYALLTRTFYAAQDTRLPVLMDGLFCLLEMAFIPLAASLFGAPGAAFTYTLISWIILMGLLGLFTFRFGSLPFRKLGVYTLLTALCAVASAWVGSQMGSIASSVLPAGPLSSALSVGVGAIVTCTLYYLATLMLHLAEARAFRNFVSGTKRRHQTAPR
jgi:putative peptidoglycan lipid II flippase